MDDYTPSTEDVRESYTYFRGTIPTVEHGAEFDRWLAAHDAEVREQTLDALRPEYSDLIPTIQARLNQ